MADDFVDESPTTLVFMASGVSLLVDDNYETLISRLNMATHEPTPTLKVTVQGEEATLILGGEAIIVLSGDRRGDKL